MKRLFIWFLPMTVLASTPTPTPTPTAIVGQAVTLNRAHEVLNPEVKFGFGHDLGTQLILRSSGDNTATQTSGLLVIGHAYVIGSYNSGDDFTNVGSPSNASEVYFIATGTTPTVWTNGSILNTKLYTPQNTGIIVTDANNAEVFRLWADGDDPNANRGNLFLGLNSGGAAVASSEFGDTGIGANALASLTANGAGDNNTAVGYLTLDQLIDGNSNTAIGSQAGHNLISGGQNFILTAGNPGTSIDVNGSTIIGVATTATGDDAIGIGSNIGNVPANSCIIGDQNVVDFQFGGSNFYTYQGAWYIGGGSKRVTVYDLLNLSPRSTPGSPQEADIYEDSSNHHFYGYDGTVFKQLDNDTPTPTPTSTPTSTPTPTATATPTPTPTPIFFTGTTGSIGGAIVGIGCDTGTATVTGATTSMVAVAEPNTYPGDAIFWKARVTNTNEVTVYVCSDVTITPTASTYKVRVIP